MNQTIKKIFIIISIYASSIILAIILAPLGEFIDKALIGTCEAGLFSVAFNIFDWGCYIQGFVYLYLFLLAVLSFLLFSKLRAWSVYIIGTFFFWILYLLYTIFITFNFRDLNKENIGSLIIMLVMFGLGWLLAQGIKFARNKLVKDKKNNFE